GAEVTMTLTPYLSDELLPTTFRNLILNDLVDQIGVPLTELVNDPDLVTLARLSDSQAKDLPPTADPQELARAIEAAHRADKARNTETTARPLQKLQAPRSATPASKLRRAFLPFPASQGLEIYGFQPALLVLRRTYRTFEKDAASKHPCEE